MSRITHFVDQSKTILFWDYYILCRLDTEAAMILQRLEFWDGVKNKSNVVADGINDELVANGDNATQDTEQFVYKSQDELKWELMGLVGANNLGTKLKLLTTELPFVVSRNNPLNPTDRKKQYHMAKDYVQIRLDYLSHILATFQKAGYRMNAVYYSIEELVREHIYVEDLDITQVAKKLVALYQQAEIDDIKAIEDRERQKNTPKGTKKPTPYEPVLPKFLRIQLKKDKLLIENIDLSSESPTFNFKEWETLKLKNDQALKLRNAIPQNQRISSNYNNNNNKQRLPNSEDDVASPTNQEPDTTTTTNHTLLEKEKNNGTQEEQPLEQLPWGAEKALRITEALVDTTYLDQQKELATCTKILATYQPTQEEYVAVVQKILGWWKGNKGILRPSDLLGKNSKTGNIRFAELLEEVRYQANRSAKESTPRTSFPNHSMSTTHGQRPEDYIASPQARSRRAQLEREWAEEDAAKAAAQRGA